MSTQKSICIEADEIINQRAQEQERKYGPIGDMVFRTAEVASAVSGEDITANNVFDVLIALKLTRMNNDNTYRDNYLDAVAYIQAKWNYNNNGQK